MRNDTRSITSAGYPKVEFPVTEPETFEECFGIPDDEAAGWAADHNEQPSDIVKAFLSGHVLNWRPTGREILKKLADAGASEDEIVEALSDSYNEFVNTSRRAASGPKVPSKKDLEKMSETDVAALKARIAELGL